MCNKVLIEAFFGGGGGGGGGNPRLIKLVMSQLLTSRSLETQHFPQYVRCSDIYPLIIIIIIIIIIIQYYYY